MESTCDSTECYRKTYREEDIFWCIFGIFFEECPNCEAENSEYCSEYLTSTREESVSNSASDKTNANILDKRREVLVVHNDSYDGLKR